MYSTSYSTENKEKGMGLDISAYRKLEKVRDFTSEDEDYYAEGLVHVYPNNDFPGRFDGLDEKALYKPGESFGFRAGSYGVYNAWREWLARLVGTTPNEAWAGFYHGPFAELINFSDCEGTIGPVVAAKLAKDFAEWDDRAKGSAPADRAWNYEVYKDWRKAMEMAADNGAVDFH